MAIITKERLYDILQKKNNDCDGYELHVRHLWKEGDSKRIFQATGLIFEDFKEFLDQEKIKDFL